MPRKSVNEKWDKRFIYLSQCISSFSKDPSTKVGSVIYDDNNIIISMGYNGFAKGIKDTNKRLNNRELKYKLVVHGEVNAILFAKRDLKNTNIATWPFSPCSNCAKTIIQAGIKKVVAPIMPAHLRERWKEDMDLAENMMKEAGIEVILYNYK